MYSRRTGISQMPISAEYLQAKYAAKKAAQETRQREPFNLLPEKTEEVLTVQTDITPVQNNKSVKDLLSVLEKDDLVLLAVLAFLLFSDSQTTPDIILCAALLFIEFG
ncbi:MAG: hypothetical protein IJO74_02470 [Clostridia bacterium]|nr:hypothetical protein [Clostridia bacterium]